MNRVSVLAGVWLVSALAVVPWAWAAGPRGAGVSALGAWATCVAGGLVAWWLACWFGDPRQVLVQVVVAMAARTGIPLGVCMAVYYRPGAWANAGFVYYLLVFYFVTLVAETTLQVACVTSAGPRPEDAPTEDNGLDHG